MVHNVIESLSEDPETKRKYDIESVSGIFNNDVAIRMVTYQ